MNDKINSTNSFTITVTDEFLSVMFNAQVPYKFESVFRDRVKPFITDVVMCEPGTGNAGKSLEYKQTTDGVCIDYLEFHKIMIRGY